ncbi:MAG TPA: alcohol dehydrogenase catalytic domain-containing protein [Planctomycetota bacterium]|nr:alcohol dehydrogenase catalytic domain-containing protein [Planctomycetota bacterium]
MADRELPKETLACMLTGTGLGYFCEYAGPKSSAELDARALRPPRGATKDQLEAWQVSADKSLAAFFRTFAPKGAPPPEAAPRDLISFMSHELIDVAPFARFFRPQRIPMYQPGPGETLAKVEAICLCFSDCKVIDQGGAHVRLFNRDLAKEPNIPGHEACLEIVQIGDGVARRHGLKIGERYVIQADIYVDGVSHAFGYFHRGAMQQYVLLPEEVLANDRGNCLIPIDAKRLEAGQFVKNDLGRAEAGLSEPWGCVAAKIEYRTALKPGGTTWFLGATKADEALVAEAARSAARVLLTGGDAAELAGECKAEVVEDMASLRRSPGTGSVDDIVLREASVALVEAAADAMATGAVMLLPPFPAGTNANLDVGAIHYKGLSFLGHTEATLAATYAKPRRTRLRPGGRAIFVGAGGPMGQIWLQTALDAPQPPRSMLVTEIDDPRLALLETLFRPQAEAKGIEIRFVNPLKTRLADVVEPESVDDIVGLCPAWMPIKATEPFVARDGLINVFAGIKAGTKGPVDIAALSQRGVTIIGNSGSAVEDLRGVVVGALRGELRPNTSVAVIGPLARVWEAMRQVMYRETSGKICIFPELALPDLIPLHDLAKHFPTVAAKLDEHGFWTREAEEELFNVCPKLRL